MFDCHVFCHPRDALDEGIDTVLDCLQGRIGATGLTLWVACDERPPWFRAHAQAIPRVQRCPGGVFFLPHEERYAASRVKPPIASAARKRDVLATASEHCVERGLDLRAALQPWRCSRLAGRHPEFAVKNACGWPDPHALCANNPDVQAYVQALLEDLSAYDGVSTIVLDLARGRAPLRLPPYLDDVAGLLEACFCESCLQQAAAEDIDGLAAQRGVLAAVDRACRGGPSHAPTRELEPVGRYSRWSIRRLTKLLADCKTACSKAVVLCAAPAPLLQEPLGRLANGLVVGPNELELAADAGLPFELAPTVPPPQAEAAGLFQDITRARERGCSGLSILEYGDIAEWQFDWIRQALRHARRSVDLEPR